MYTDSAVSHCLGFQAPIVKFTALLFNTQQLHGDEPSRKFIVPRLIEKFPDFVKMAAAATAS
jgi:hypothetical protein